MTHEPYRFEVTAKTEETTSPGAIINGVQDNILSGSKGTDGGSGGSGYVKKTFADGMLNRLEHSGVTRLVSPLNSATGGLALTGARAGVMALKGAGSYVMGGIAFSAALQGVQLVVNSIEKRIQRLENEAYQKNERDNVLIRAGAKSYVTEYKGNFWGVKASNNRR